MREDVVIEDDAPDGALLTAAEEVEKHIIRPNARVAGDEGAGAPTAIHLPAAPTAEADERARLCAHDVGVRERRR